MVNQPWMVIGSPRVEWYLPDDMDQWPQWHHMSTRVTGFVGETARARGHVVWATQVCARNAVLAWDWVEIKPGVAVLADVNAVLTNLRFTSQEGEDLEELEGVVNANRIIHTLPWQLAVRSLLDRVRRQALDSGHQPDADFEWTRQLSSAGSSGRVAAAC